MTVKWSCHFKFVLRCYLFYAVGGRATKSSQISRERRKDSCSSTVHEDRIEVYYEWSLDSA